MTAAEDERQPLLPPAALASDAQLHARPHPQDEESPITPEAADTEGAEVVEVKRQRSWWGFAWRVILAALAVFFTVLFVKGFIDAKDVNVSVGMDPWTRSAARLSCSADTPV